MLAFASAWIGLATLLLALAMVLHRPWMTDLTMTLLLYFGAPGALCLGGMVLWAHRKERSGDRGVSAQRLQAKAAVAMAVLAVGIGYALVMLADRVAPVEGGA